VVGGSAASNPTAQLGLARKQQWEQSDHCAKPVHLRGSHRAHTRASAVRIRCLVPAFSIQRNDCPQPVWTSHLHRLQRSCKEPFQLLVRSFANGNELALSLCAITRKTHSRRPKLTLDAGLPDEFSTGWNEAHGARATIFSPTASSTAHHTWAILFSRQTTPSFCRSAQSALHGAPLARRPLSAGLRHV